MTQPQPVESVFSRSWELLTRNWIIVVPGIVIGVILGVINAIFTPHVVYNPDGSVVLGSAFASVWTRLFLGLVGLLAFIATQAYTTGMAGAAWMRGTTTLADGSASFREDAGRILITAVGLLVLAIVATILALPTLGLSLLAFYLFTLYAFPAAIVGNRPGFSSIAESFRITAARFVPTLFIGIVIFAISFIAGIISGLLGFIPFLGPIVGGILTQIVVAFAVLVIVGEYLNLRALGTIPPPTPPPGPAASAPPVV